MAHDPTRDPAVRMKRLGAMRRLMEVRREEAVSRHAVSERMKKYWAARRTSKAGLP